MSRDGEPRAVPGAAAAICLAVTLAATVFAAAPLYDPLRRDFGWPAAGVIASGAGSIAISGWLFRRCLAASSRYGPRLLATLGALSGGLLALLYFPNLTHLWQFGATLGLLGVARAAALGGQWWELRRCAGFRWGAGLAIAGAALAAFVIAPWLAVIVQRNSWREGSAACAGLLLVIVAPLGYVLMSGPQSKVPVSKHTDG